MFQVSDNSNILHFPLNFYAYYIPLIFALEQLKIPEVWTSL